MNWCTVGCAALLTMFACTQGSDVATAPTEQRNELHQELELDEWSALVVPPEDGPKLAPLALHVPVLAKPERAAEEIGYLRLGSRVARSAEPVSVRDCPEGWYALRPVGFVCAGDQGIGLDLEHPLLRAIDVEPDRSRPLPYAYAFVRAVAPNYLRIPTKGEQLEREMRLERHLRNWKRLQEEWSALDVGANDVTLDEAGRGVGEVPDQPRPLGMNQRYGGNGDDEVPWWLQEGKRLIPNVSSFKAPHYAIMADRIRRHAGVALVGSFVAGEEAQNRRFAITTDARLIPADKLKPDSGSAFHGHDIREVGLPVAFARKAGATYWSYENGDLKRAEPLGWREFVPLTGKVTRMRGVKMVQARNGQWLRGEDVKTAVKPSDLPWFASGDRRWIYVSLLSQTLVLWEGSQPVYATLVSTGRDGMGDPKKTLSTPQGTFRIEQKHVTTTMDSDVADSEFELRDVPWVMYFKGGYALHAAYWHDDFGRPRSHGCINLSPIDARYVFEWSSPDVPAHWQGAYAGETFDQGTIIQIGM